MDILAHGLYGGVGYINKSKRSFWLAFFWGIFPDLAAFGIAFPLFVWRSGINREYLAHFEPPADYNIPHYVSSIYNFSHSLIIFTAIFLLIWFFLKRPVYEMLPWGLHIVMDIPSHTSQFFPTPFLYPLSSFYVSGISWATPSVFFSYWSFLIILYIIQFVRRKRLRIK